MKQAPDFKNHEEHDKWVIENADYFTAIGSAYRARARFEFETLEQAREMAHSIAKDAPNGHAIVYAVCGVYSAYVETVRKQEENHE